MEIIDRRLPEYEAGVERFLEFSFKNMKTNKIRCPCVKCNNYYQKTRDDVKGDLLFDGIVMGYTRWVYHGEEFEPSSSDDESNEEGFDDMFSLVNDLYGNENNYHESREEPSGSSPNTPNKEANTFFRLLGYVEQELYPGCENYSKLSFLVKLFHMKCLNGWSNKSFNQLLKFFKEVLPNGNKGSDSHYEAKIIRDLGLNYVKIDVCQNDCRL